VAQAATWSDTFIGYRYGADFTEPVNDNKVAKHMSFSEDDCTERQKSTAWRQSK